MHDIATMVVGAGGGTCEHVGANGARELEDGGEVDLENLIGAGNACQHSVTSYSPIPTVRSGYLTEETGGAERRERVYKGIVNVKANWNPTSSQSPCGNSELGARRCMPAHVTRILTSWPSRSILGIK